jgi:hypothetical protein
MKEDKERNFVRLDIDMGIRIRSAKDQKLDLGKQSTSLLAVRLRDIDQLMQDKLIKLEERAPETCHLVALLNRKLKILEELILQPDVNEMESKKVNLSGSGFAVQSDQFFEPGSVLGVELLMPPIRYHWYCLASVVTCAGTQAPYHLRAHFENITEEEQDAIVEFVLSHERKILKARRAAKDEK